MTLLSQLTSQLRQKQLVLAAHLRRRLFGAGPTCTAIGAAAVLLRTIDGQMVGVAAQAALDVGEVLLDAVRALDGAVTQAAAQLTARILA